ncbi:hypothetical protein M9Y10_023810 [Tritrichomonas musculus]|uniref:Uncharacterized protein n=1 Tax=Tritrichomonas musculus TaxID=1915356 RepID=A0ABR2KW83_9EUKA
MYEKHHNGRSPGYLSDVETFIFQKIIHNRGLDMDCIKTIEAVQIAFNCREFRFTRATELSEIMTRQCSPSKSIQTVMTRQSFFQIEQLCN